MTPEHPRRSRGLIAAAIACALIAGCDTLTDRLGLTGEVSPVEPRPIDSARLRVTLLSSGVEAVLAPVARQKDVIVWQTLDGVTLTFDDDLLVETRGLGNDLMSADVTNNLVALRTPSNPEYYPHFRTYLDGEDRTTFQSFQCRLSWATQQSDTVKSLSGNARPVQETCTSLTNEFENTYWINASGALVKTRQWINPEIGFMETEYVPR